MAISFPAISAPGGVSFVPGTIVPANGAVVINGATETIKNISATVSSTGTIGVAGGAVTFITLAANTSLVSNGTALTVPVTGIFLTTITPAVDANGNITGFVLS